MFYSHMPKSPVIEGNEASNHGEAGSHGEARLENEAHHISSGGRDNQL